MIESWNNFIRLHGGEPGARDVFEKLMDNLLRAENPGKEVHIIKAAQGDGGIDVYVHQKKGIDVYQCKFFMDAMNASRWDQVEDSFERVLEFIDSEKAKGVKLRRWFLCMPREMRKEDIAKWNEFCEKRKSLGINLRHIDGNAIIQRLQKCDWLQGTNLIDQYFGVTKNIPKCLTSIPTVNRTVGLVGREKVMQTVLSLLEKEDRLALVSGLGGIGKTAVMQWICNDLKNKGNYVAWIDCGGSLKEDLLILGGALGIVVADKETAYRKIINTLKNDLSSSLYLFLDNLTENPGNEVLDDLNSLNAHIMVTSRGTNDAFPKIKLEELEEDQAVTMFFQYYNGDTDCGKEDSARSIVTSVNRHTLLIEILAKAAKRSGGTLEDFNARLEKEGVYNVFRRKVNTAHDGNATIEECVIKLYEVSHLSEEQKRIMKLFSVFTPEREIYYKVAEWAELDMDAVDELVDLGWLEQGGSENNYKIHQIIKDSLTIQMKYSREPLKIEEYGRLLIKVADTKSYISGTLEYMKVRERLGMAEDIAQHLMERIKNLVLSTELSSTEWMPFNEIAKLYINIAEVYHVQGNYDKALHYCEEALSIQERELGTEHLSTASTYNNIAGVYYNLGNYNKALEFYGKAMTISESVLGNDAPETAVIYSNVGVVYHAQGNYDKTLELYGKALAVQERILGVDEQSTITTYSNIAGVYFDQGNYDKALEYYCKVLTIRERILGTSHLLTARSYNNIAEVYHAQGDYEKALTFLKKALAINERIVGIDHPSMGLIYNNIAGVYENQGDYDKALDLYGKALEINKKVLGVDHLDTATAYDNIASVYYAQNNYDRALEFYEKTLTIYKRILGINHSDTARTFDRIALLYSYKGNYDKALEYYGEALSIRNRSLAPDHPDIALSYKNIAQVNLEQGNYDKSLEYYEKALDIRKSVLGSNHLDTGVIYGYMAIMYEHQGEYEKALKYYKKALSVFQKEEPDHKTTKAVQKAIERLENKC